MEGKGKKVHGCSGGTTDSSMSLSHSRTATFSQGRADSDSACLHGREGKESTWQ